MIFFIVLKYTLKNFTASLSFIYMLSNHLKYAQDRYTKYMSSLFSSYASPGLCNKDSSELSIMPSINATDQRGAAVQRTILFVLLSKLMMRSWLCDVEMRCEILPGARLIVQCGFLCMLLEEDSRTWDKHSGHVFFLGVVCWPSQFKASFGSLFVRFMHLFPIRQKFKNRL